MSTQSPVTNLDLPLAELKAKRVASTMYDTEETLRAVFHSSVEIQTIMYFFKVASSHQPLDQAELAKQLGLTRASSSRNYYRLSGGLRGTEGLDLIEAIDDPKDYRRKLLKLTPKGRLVMLELSDKLLSSFGRLISNVS